MPTTFERVVIVKKKKQSNAYLVFWSLWITLWNIYNLFFLIQAMGDGSSVSSALLMALEIVWLCIAVVFYLKEFKN